MSVKISKDADLSKHPELDRDKEYKIVRISGNYIYLQGLKGYPRQLFDLQKLYKKDLHQLFNNSFQ